VLELLLSGLGDPIFRVFPYLQVVFMPLVPLLVIYTYSAGGIAIVQLAVFLALFAGVVRNYKVVHFLRFHTIQALLIGIFVFLCNAVLGLLGITRAAIGLGTSSIESLFWNPLMSVIFVGVIAGVIYSVIQSARGLYSELPMVSEAAYRSIN